MGSRSLAATMITAAWIAGCTAVYHREFIAQTAEPSSAEDRQQIVDRYREFMERNGYTSSSITNASGKWVSFNIRDARSRVLPTSRISDQLTLGTDAGGEIRVRILRVTSYPPDDFSEKYLADFVVITENYMKDTSGKDIKLRMVNDK